MGSMGATLPLPLSGVRVVELAGIGPGPFATMMLAELGADVIRIDRPGGSEFFPDSEDRDLLNRGKRSIALDLRDPEDLGIARALASRSHVVVEGYRPGVAEKMGLGPAECLADNPALVYGRMTGWGQDGPDAQTAGHDINYISVTGALHAMGPADRPVPPLNLVGDFGGGALYLVVGILAALRVAGEHGRGQVVDASVVDGTAHLLTGIHALLGAGTWRDQRGVNMLDGGMPFYDTYATSEGGHMAVGCLEPRFYREIVTLLGVDLDPADQYRAASWAAAREAITAAFRARTREEWTRVFAGSDACVTPVLSMREAANWPQLAARGTLSADEPLQAAPSPRFSASAAPTPTPPPLPDQDRDEILRELSMERSDLSGASR